MEVTHDSSSHQKILNYDKDMCIDENQSENENQSINDDDDDDAMENDNGDEEEYEYEYEVDDDSDMAVSPYLSNFQKGNTFRYNLTDFNQNDNILLLIFRVMKDVTSRLKYVCECNWEPASLTEQQKPILSITGPHFQHDLLYDFTESFIDENSTMLDKPVRIYPLTKLSKSDIYYTCCKHPALFRDNWNPFVDLVHVTVSIIDSIEAARTVNMNKGEDDSFMLLNDPDSVECVIRDLYYDFEAFYRHYQSSAFLSISELLPSIKSMRILPYTDPDDLLQLQTSSKRKGIGYSDRLDDRKGLSNSSVWTYGLAQAYAQKKIPTEKIFKSIVLSSQPTTTATTSSNSTALLSDSTADRLTSSDLKWVFYSPLLDIFETWLVECSKEEYYRHQGK